MERLKAIQIDNSSINGRVIPEVHYWEVIRRSITIADEKNELSTDLIPIMGFSHSFS